MDKQTYLTVVKSNKVVEASYMLTLSEQRILLACIAQIDAKAGLLEHHKFEVTVGQIENLANVDNAYNEVKEASEKLLKRLVRIDNPDPDNPNLAYTLTHWVDSCDYYPKEGKVTLSFSRRIIPYLSQLTRNFTQYKLKNIAQMKSVYSIRLYELLVQWTSTGEREIEIDWLKRQFQIEGKYNRLSNLKLRVIDPAVEEINKYTDLWVRCSQRKAGRTITHFHFQFGLKEAPPEKPKRFTDAEINRQARPGETRAAVIARLTGNSVADFAKPGESWDEAAQRKKKRGDVKR